MAAAYLGPRVVLGLHPEPSPEKSVSCHAHSKNSSTMQKAVGRILWLGGQQKRPSLCSLEGPESPGCRTESPHESNNTQL